MDWSFAERMKRSFSIGSCEGWWSRLSTWQALESLRRQTWACLWGSFQTELVDVGRSTLNIGSTAPWAEVLDGLTRTEKASCEATSVVLCFLTALIHFCQWGVMEKGNLNWESAATRLNAGKPIWVFSWLMTNSGGPMPMLVGLPLGTWSWVTWKSKFSELLKGSQRIDQSRMVGNTKGSQGPWNGCYLCPESTERRTSRKSWAWVSGQDQ